MKDLPPILDKQNFIHQNAWKSKIYLRQAVTYYVGSLPVLMHNVALRTGQTRHSRWRWLYQMWHKLPSTAFAVFLSLSAIIFWWSNYCPVMYIYINAELAFMCLSVRHVRLQWGRVCVCVGEGGINGWGGMSQKGGVRGWGDKVVSGREGGVRGRGGGTRTFCKFWPCWIVGEWV